MSNNTHPPKHGGEPTPKKKPRTIPIVVFLVVAALVSTLLIPAARNSSSTLAAEVESPAEVVEHEHDDDASADAAATDTDPLDEPPVTVEDALVTVDDSATDVTDQPDTVERSLDTDDAEQAPEEQTQLRTEEATPEAEEETPADVEQVAVDEPAPEPAVSAENLELLLEPSDDSVVVNNLAEVRDAELPVWVEMELAGHDRYLELAEAEDIETRDDLWAGLSTEQLVEPFEYPVTVNPAEAHEAQAEFEAEYAEVIAAVAEEKGVELVEVDRTQDRSQFLWLIPVVIVTALVVNEVCTDRPWDSPEFEDFEWALYNTGTDLTTAQRTQEFGDGLRARINSSAQLEGNVTIDGDVTYQRKVNRCFELPAGLRVLELNVDINIEAQGSLSTSTTIGVGYQNDSLVRLDPISLGRLREVTIPVVPGVDIKLGAHLELVLGIKLEAEAQVRFESTVTEDYSINGNYLIEVHCYREEATGNDKCESEDTSNLGFDVVDHQPRVQTSLDVTVTPWAELRLSAAADLAIISDLLRISIIEGTFGIIVELPTRLHWTAGNACSDGNGDGQNEYTEVLFVDIQMVISAYWDVQLLKDHVSAWKTGLEFIGSDKIEEKVGGALDDLFSFDGRQQVFAKHLYFDTLNEADNTPFSPVLQHVGQFDRGNGLEEGVVIEGTRTCYPFNSPVEYEIDWSQHNDDVTRVSETGFVAYDWPDASTNGDQIEVRIVRDDFGRSFDAGNRNTTSAPVTTWEVGGDLIQAPAVSLVADGDNVMLDWDPVDGAEHYVLRHNGQTSGATLAVPGVNLSGSGWAEGTFTVTAVSTFPEWEESAQSNAIVWTRGLRPQAIVSLGDSFISGEGGRWQGNATNPGDAYLNTDRGRDAYVDDSRGNGCNRSDVAEVRSAAVPGLVPINLACSGAQSKDIIGPEFSNHDPKYREEGHQIDQLIEVTDDYDVAVIVLSIGGNDIGFSDIVQECISNYVTHADPCNGDYSAQERAERMQNATRAVIDEIERTMVAQGQPDYRLILQSYVSPVPDAAGNRHAEGLFHLTDNRAANGCAVYDEDLDWVRHDFVGKIDDLYKELALEKGIEFLSLKDAFDGKEVCGRDATVATVNQRATASTMEWVVGGNVQNVIAGDIQELFHPNALGQQAIGKCLNQVVANNGSQVHVCNRTGATPHDMYVTSSGSINVVDLPLRPVFQEPVVEAVPTDLPVDEPVVSTEETPAPGIFGGVVEQVLENVETGAEETPAATEEQPVPVAEVPVDEEPAAEAVTVAAPTEATVEAPAPISAEPGTEAVTVEAPAPTIPEPNIAESPVRDDEPVTQEERARYELVVQDDMYRYVLDTINNTRAWAGHCNNAVLNATPSAVTWSDIIDMPDEPTPACEELTQRLATGSTAEAVANQSESAAQSRYELVVQDDMYRYVLDTINNTRAWAGHCNNAVLNATPSAVTWSDIIDMPDEPTPSCDVLTARLAN